MTEAQPKRFSISLRCVEPHPFFEIMTDDFNRLITWLLNPVPGENLSLLLNGHTYRFRTYEERRQFAMGFEKMLEIHERITETLQECIDDLLFGAIDEIRDKKQVRVEHHSEIRFKAVRVASPAASTPIAAIKLRKIAG